MKIATLDLLALMSLLPSICSAVALPDTEVLSLKYPAATYLYQLEDFEDQGALAKRTDITVCEYIGAAAACVGIVIGLRQIVQELATTIKNLADNHDCSEITTTAGGGKVKYRFYATGGHCGTTAQLSTIAGAIEHHLKSKNDGKLCRTECLDLTHGGTWDGYLLVGPAKGFESNMYCGPHLPFKNCDSGGEGDFH